MGRSTTACRSSRWLWQLNRGVFKSPGSKWESWTTSIVMSDEDAERYVENFESFADAITS